MWNLVGVEAHPAHLPSCPGVVLEIHGVLQEEGRLPLRRPDLDGKSDGRTDDHPIGPLLDQDGRAFFDAELLAELGRNDHCSTLSDLGRFAHRRPLPDYQTFGQRAQSLRRVGCRSTRRSSVPRPGASPTLSAGWTSSRDSFAAQLFPLTDSADDAAPDPSRTLSFTFDLGACLDRNGIPRSGLVLQLTLTATGEPEQGGTDRAAAPGSCLSRVLHEEPHPGTPHSHEVAVGREN